MQIMEQIRKIFEKAGINLYIRTYDIIVISANSGIIEFIPDTVSIDVIKKEHENFTDLHDFFVDTFKDDFEEAQKNFIESLAAYSLICYLLQIKDRHNGNILIDAEGHIIHIDFGFLLGTNPGGINFENAPFKLTKEYVKVMGGLDSEMFLYFKILFFKGFIELKNHVDSLMIILEIMQKNSDLPCF